jgi:hypothetical protein
VAKSFFLPSKLSFPALRELQTQYKNAWPTCRTGGKIVFGNKGIIRENWRFLKAKLKVILPVCDQK